MSQASMSRSHHRLSSRKHSPAARLRLILEQLEDRCVPSVTGFRPIDEVGNNIDDPTLGTAGIDLLRVSPAAYRVVAGTDPNGFFTPSMNGGAPFFVSGSRLASNDLSNQSTTLFDPNPANDINTVNQNGLSAFGYTWGQFLDHDMDLTPDTPVNDFPIPKDPKHDGILTPGVPFPEVLDPLTVGPADALRMGRSVFNPATGTTSPREQINVNTAFLDLSQVYGSTTGIAASLRTGIGGLLKSSPGADNAIGTPDDLLPFNNTTYFSPAELTALNMANDSHQVPSTDLFAAGDVRANETTELTSLHTLFLRNHNRLATALAQQNPANFGLASWDDNTLYEEARKLNIAQYQNITYNGYLPALLGPTALAAYSGYDSGVDPSISTEFSTVGFRFGHSLLNNTVPRHANNGSSVGDITLLNSFFNPHFLTPGKPGYTDIGAVLKGGADINAQAMDEMAVSSIRNLLFGNDGSGNPIIGEDLIARDMWRAHDHGIGTYNDLRIAFGLAPITDTGGGTFADYVEGQPFHGFEQISSDPAVVTKLVIAYAGPTRDAFLQNGKFAGSIDPFAAGMAEDHVPGSDLGPLFHAILVDQFERLRDGDRFFHLNYAFTQAEANLIGAGDTLAEVIKTNTTITNLQADVFRFLAQENGRDKGFFTNKNGQAALTGSPNGTTLPADLKADLLAALTKPGDPTRLVLVDASGGFVSVTLFDSFANIKSFLQNANNSAANKLSGQLLTTMFNVFLDKVDPTTSIYVPAISGGQALSASQQTSLLTNGVTNPSGIASIQDILDAAIAELLDPNPDSTFMDALKNCLDGINKNQAIFILN